MDDMKKLIDKYKQELMQYAAGSGASRRSSQPAAEPEPQTTAPVPREEPPSVPEPAGDLAPIEEPEPSDTAEEPEPTPEASSPRTPTIISWSADQTAARELEKYFDDFSTLPPQFTDAPPQLDAGNDNVSSENNSITDATEPGQPAEFQREGGNTTADPGQFDSIGTIPESGQSPEEQLGRRSFESQQPAVNSPEDIKPLEQTSNGGFPDYPAEKEYADLDEFLKVNPGQGRLRFRTYTARNALPVPGARIIVTKVIGGSCHTFYDLTTDSSGQTPEVALPAPSSKLSLDPQVPVQPYSLYDADINAAGYIPVSVRSLPVFEGILSLQRVALVPSSGKNDKPETITENEPELTEVHDA